MPLTTVLVTAHWTLERYSERARVSCDVALLQDDDDRGFYELRVTLNGAPAYARLWNSHGAVMADADAALRDFLNAGWTECRSVDGTIAGR